MSSSSLLFGCQFEEIAVAIQCKVVVAIKVVRSVFVYLEVCTVDLAGKPDAIREAP